jgi:hypothetical protein
LWAIQQRADTTYAKNGKSSADYGHLRVRLQNLLFEITQHSAKTEPLFGDLARYLAEFAACSAV